MNAWSEIGGAPVQEAKGDARQAMAGPAKIEDSVPSCESKLLSASLRVGGGMMNLIGMQQRRPTACGCAPSSSASLPAAWQATTSKGEKRANGQELQFYQHINFHCGFGRGHMRQMKGLGREVSLVESLSERREKGWERRKTDAR